MTLFADMALSCLSQNPRDRRRISSSICHATLSCGLVYQLLLGYYSSGPFFLMLLILPQMVTHQVLIYA